MQLQTWCHEGFLISNCTQWENWKKRRSRIKNDIAEGIILECVRVKRLKQLLLIEAIRVKRCCRFMDTAFVTAAKVDRKAFTAKISQEVVCKAPFPGLGGLLAEVETDYGMGTSRDHDKIRISNIKIWEKENSVCTNKQHVKNSGRSIFKKWKGKPSSSCSTFRRETSHWQHLPGFFFKQLAVTTAVLMVIIMW